MVKQLRVLADYNCYPIWEVEGNNIDPSKLPISDTLTRRLMDWATAYDKTLNQDYPPDSKFCSQQVFEDFEKEGLRLSKDLQSELGTEFTVTYFSQKEQRDLY